MTCMRPLLSEILLCFSEMDTEGSGSGYTCYAAGKLTNDITDGQEHSQLWSEIIIVK